jgi:hypothetical protein
MVTQDMVGQFVAIFTAVESKTIGDTLSKDQKNFLDQVYKAGGLAYVARETANGPLLVQWPDVRPPRSVTNKKSPVNRPMN